MIELNNIHQGFQWAPIWVEAQRLTKGHVIVVDEFPVPYSNMKSDRHELPGPLYEVVSVSTSRFTTVDVGKGFHIFNPTDLVYVVDMIPQKGPQA